MRVKSFKYEKKPGDISEREVAVMNHSDGAFEGIDIKSLTKEEGDEFHKIQKQYEEDMKPFMKKAYRRFITEKIVDKSLMEEYR